MENIFNIDIVTSLEQHSISIAISIHWWLILTILSLLGFIYLINRYYFSNNSSLKLKNVQLNLGKQKFTYQIEQNYLNLDIAHKIYIELITRKAALPIDEQNDIISEIYDSWYELFKTTRNELKAINGETLHNDRRTEELIKMVTEVLNKGLRPHLTLYQGKFRKWYHSEIEKEENKALSPQEIQANYPEIEQLISSMKEVNILLQTYANELRDFIYQ